MTGPSGATRIDPARIVTAVIGLVALLAVVLVIATTDDSTSSAASPSGVGSAAPPVAVQSPTLGSSGSAGRPGTSGRVPTKAYLMANFPVIPGARTYSGRSVPSKGDHWFEYSGSIETVRSFYATALPRAGVSCNLTNGSYAKGYGCQLRPAAGDPAALPLGLLQIRAHVDGEPAGVILIQALFPFS